MKHNENTERALLDAETDKCCNLDGTSRPTEDPENGEYAEVNTKPGLTGKNMMSGVISSPQSNYEGWNGVDDLDPEDYSDLAEIERILP